jgi:NTP pyrophosphatase (non-canonical NTP hydrolase)
MRAHSLNEWARYCHDLSAAAGWWPEEPTVETFATKLVLINSEISEMLEGLRIGLPDDHIKDLSMEAVGAADILIRLFDYAGARGLDLEDALRAKLDYNRDRLDHKKEVREAEGGKKFSTSPAPSIEDMYQAFKLRMIEEVRVQSAELARVGELVDITKP